jgi:hypothetical protein
MRPPAPEIMHVLAPVLFAIAYIGACSFFREPNRGDLLRVSRSAFLQFNWHRGGYFIPPRTSCITCSEIPSSPSFRAPRWDAPSVIQSLRRGVSPERPPSCDEALPFMPAMSR